MGNGPGVILLDFETSSLDVVVPRNPLIFMGGGLMQPWYPNSQYVGTEWAHYNRLTKREEAFAKLQVFLIKIGLQKHLEDEDERRADCRLAEKRLKRAKWARYQKKAP